MNIARVGQKKTVLKVILICLAGITIALIFGFLALGGRASAPQATVHSAQKLSTPSKPGTKPENAATPSITAPPTPFDKSAHSTSDASSLWVVVNKQHPLSPIDYAPSDLTSAYGHQVSGRLVSDLDTMIRDAAKDGAYITLVSSYRSYLYQVNLYNSYVAADGQEKADTYSARPGYSEHQTGLAIDFGDRAGTCSVEDCYADTAEGKWLATHAYQYGFLLRYTNEKQSVTGYEAEAWHYRYVGKGLANEMHSRGITTLEEFFNISGGTAYN